MRQVSSFILVVVLLLAVPGSAQDIDSKARYPFTEVDTTFVEPAPPLPDGYGTNDWQILNVSWSSLLPLDGSSDWEYEAGQFVSNTGSGTWYCAGLDALPNGALITTVGTYYYDTNAGLDPAIELGYGHGAGSWTEIKEISPSYSSGYTLAWFDLGLGHTVDQYNNTYTMCFNFKVSDASIRLRNFRILYYLQVSPAPATATFNDVPTNHSFFRFVEALADSGITSGCGNNNFCPDAPLTRGQMAVFLAKALGLHYPAF